MSNTIGTLNIKIGVDSAPAAAGFKELTGELKVFVHQVESVKPAGLKDTVDHLKGAADAADKAKGSVGGLWHNLKGLAGGAIKGGIAGIAAGLTLGLGSVGVGGLGEVFGGSVDLAAKAEANAMAFEVMTGSAERAVAVMKDIRTYAKESPFGVDGVTKATRGLIAYGLANEKAVPTVRMLGEVASASGENAGETLDRLVLAYGQVYTAGRLMGTELKQFTEAGVPLIDELAKVLKRPKAEIKAMSEQGKVSFRDVAMAFRNMTAAGGRFFGMSERYADTFQGTIDRLTDGIDDLKREFGVALIEELGLKDAAKDGEKFAAEMKKLVDDVRPAIRFAGDLGRGLAQVLGEGVRNAPLFAQVFGSALRKASPELAAYADRAMDLIDDLKSFKLDPVKVIEFAADIGVAFARVADVLVTKLREGLAGIYQGEVKQIVDSLVAAATTWERIKGALDSTLDLVDDFKQWQRRNDLKDKGQMPAQEAFAAERMKADGLDDVLVKLKKQADRRWTLREAGDPVARAEVDDRQHFLRQYIADVEEKRAKLHAARYRAEFAETASERRAAAEQAGQMERAIAQRLRDDAADAYRKLGGTAPLKFGGADLTQPAAQPRTWEQSAREIRDEIMRPFADRAREQNRKGGGLRFGLDFTNAANAAAKGLAKTRKELEGLAVLPDMPAVAGDAFVAPQLPPVVEYGTAEFARLAGQAMYQPLETEADLLRRILTVNEEQRDALRAGLFNPSPVPVRLPE